jgi:hypothetical protein
MELSMYPTKLFVDETGSERLLQKAFGPYRFSGMHISASSYII